MSESVHYLEILKALCLCWANINEDSDQHNMRLDSVKNELILAGTMLVKSIEATVDIRAELAPLLCIDGGLGILFGFPEVA